MPRLKELNARQKKFCRLYTQGETAGNIAQSHRKAGYVCPTIEGHGGNGLRLLRSERIQKEIARLRDNEFKKDCLSFNEKRSFLAKVVRTPVGELHEGSELAQEVTISETKEGTVKKIKAVDKVRAIEVDNKMSGDNFADREPQANNHFSILVQVSRLAAQNMARANAVEVEPKAVELEMGEPKQARIEEPRHSESPIS
jgi:phage terminase small subunit